MNVLLFTTCAPFQGEKKYSQQIALDSWRLLLKDTSVMTFGEHPYAGHFVHVDGLPCAKHILPVESDAPLLNEMWKFAYAWGQDMIDVFVMVNSDIVLDGGLFYVLETLHRHYEPYPNPMAWWSGWARRRNCPKELWQQLLCQDDYIWERMKVLEYPYHDYAGYDLFFWSKPAFEKHVALCPEFVYNGWCTDHYINWTQKHISNHQWEITEVVDCVHLDHEAKDPRNAHDSDWETTVQHNLRICQRLKMPHKKHIRKPPMLTDNILGRMKDGTISDSTTNPRRVF